MSRGPRRVGWDAPAWPLFGREGTQRIERAAQAGVAPHALMARAGWAVARLGRALVPHAARVWVLAGPGNNGGDALEAATHLAALGLDVRVALAADPAALPDDARRAHARACAAGLAIAPHLPGDDAEPPHLVIDGLLGVGARRGLDGALAALAARVNATGCPVLAIDLPSGLHADTGQPLGPHTVHATHTLALLTLKPGLFTGHGRDLAGDVWFDDLDVLPVDTSPLARLVAAPAVSGRRHVQHKGSFGDVVVVGGAEGMAGAALLAARAALAAGAGRVHVDLLGDAAVDHDVGRPELMCRPHRRQGALPPHATVVAGCGGGEAIAARLPALLHDAERLVLDADALNAVAGDPSLRQRLAARGAHGRPTVLTPHPLEAARLLDTTTEAVQHDRLAAACALADRCAATVVLKGSGSVVAAPGALPSVNPTGNAALATAGTGDVLAGWLAGHWAATSLDAAAAACEAVWAHGRAADLHPTAPLRAADLVEALHGLSRR